MKNFWKKVLNFLIGNSFLIPLLLCFAIIIPDIFYNFIIIQTDLLSISMAVLGFLITALTIFLSLPENNNFMKFVKKYGKDKEFYKIMISAISLFILCSIFSFINCFKNIKIDMYFFILAFSEMILVVYYLFRIVIGISKNKN